MFVFFIVKLSSFEENRIPNRLEVLGRLLQLTSVNKKSVSVASNIIAMELINIWQTLRNPIALRESRSVVRSIKHMYEIYRKMQKNVHRIEYKEIAKKAVFHTYLHLNFNISKEMEERSEDDIFSEISSISRSTIRSTATVATTSTAIGLSESEYHPPEPKKMKKTSESFKMTTDFAGTLDRGGASNVSATRIINTMPSQNVPTSVSTVRRQRIAAREKVYEEIKRNFTDDLDEHFFVLHFDNE